MNEAKRVLFTRCIDRLEYATNALIAEGIVFEDDCAEDREFIKECRAALKTKWGVMYSSRASCFWSSDARAKSYDTEGEAQAEANRLNAKHVHDVPQSTFRYHAEPRPDEEEKPR